MRSRLVLFVLLCASLLPAPVRAQELLRNVESNLPALAGARVRAERLATRRSSNVVIMGLLERGLPFAGLYTLLTEAQRVTPDGEVTYLPSYNVENLPDALWNGDVLFEDLTGDGRADILMMGDARRDSAAVPAPVVVLYREGVPSRVRLLPSLPALYGSRFALDGTLLATAGRGAAGLVLEVHRLTRATTPTFTRLATLPGLEFPALALGDCDGDGDGDLFAAGADAAGLPTATLYRNDAGTFTAVATLPGLFRGEAAFGDLNRDGTADLVYSGYRYGPGFAEGNVYAYRMNGCVPAPLVVPDPLRTMMAEFVALEDVTGDGRLDLLVSGLEEPFQGRVAHFRVATGNGIGGFTHLPLADRFSYGFGAGTLLTLPTGGPRHAFFGIGLSVLDQVGTWFYSRPGGQN